MKKDWKDFEHEVSLKLKGYSDKGCFNLVPKPTLKHELDKAEYRLPEFILISDENKLIVFLDCKKNYWKNIDMGSLDRLGWAIRAFLDNKGEYDLPNSSKIHFPQKRPQKMATDEYILLPVLLCTGAEFEDFKKGIMYLPETETEIQYTILNFKGLDNFIKLNFHVPSYSSSFETIKKRMKQGELTIDQYSEILNLLKDVGPKHYLTNLDIKKDIIKDSDIEIVLKYLYAGATISPIELKRFGRVVFKDNTSVGVTVESYKEDTKIYLPLGTEKTADIILKLLNKKLIKITESSYLVWVMDGTIILQPPGTKFKGKNLEGEVIAFVFNVTDEGKKLLENIYGKGDKLWKACWKDKRMGIGL